MMFVLTRKEMQQIDRRTIEDFGLPGAILMENAGRGCAREISSRLKTAHSPVLVVCGSGNNGGDGFVIARCLHDQGHNPRVILVHFRHADREPEALMSPETLRNYRLCLKLGLPIQVLTSPGIRWQDDEPRPDLIVDAVFGIGFRGEIDPDHKALFATINGMGIPVIAIDIPSGVDADTGLACGAVKSELTLTMAYPKQGHFLSEGRRHTGKLHVIDIGIPRDGFGDPLSEATWLTTPVLPVRDPLGHKGDFGRIAIIAGSPGLTGAATLAARASLRAGGGLITLFHPPGLETIFEIKLTEVMTKALPTTKESDLDTNLLGILLGGFDTLLIGPGIGTNLLARQCVDWVLRRWDKPAVFDADALNILGTEKELVELLRDKPFLLTPHPGEFCRLSGLSMDMLTSDIVTHLRRYCRDQHTSVLLKGATTIFCDGMHLVFVTTGNDGLSTGGSGDVLAGIIVSLMAQGLDIRDAAPSGSWLLGTTAEMLAEARCTASVIPSDVIEGLFVRY